MSNITIFTAPKPFSDPHINIIQRNAVRSWKMLGPDAEVLLIGDENGIKEEALIISSILMPILSCFQIRLKSFSKSTRGMRTS